MGKKELVTLAGFGSEKSLEVEKVELPTKKEQTKEKADYLTEHYIAAIVNGTNKFLQDYGVYIRVA